MMQEQHESSSSSVTLTYFTLMQVSAQLFRHHHHHSKRAHQLSRRANVVDERHGERFRARSHLVHSSRGRCRSRRRRPRRRRGIRSWRRTSRSASLYGAQIHLDLAEQRVDLVLHLLNMFQKVEATLILVDSLLLRDYRERRLGHRRRRHEGRCRRHGLLQRRRWLTCDDGGGRRDIAVLLLYELYEARQELLHL